MCRLMHYPSMTGRLSELRSSGENRGQSVNLDAGERLSQRWGRQAMRLPYNASLGGGGSRGAATYMKRALTHVNRWAIHESCLARHMCRRMIR